MNKRLNRLVRLIILTLLFFSCMQNDFQLYAYMICVPPLVQLHVTYDSNWYLCFEVPGELGDSGGMVQDLLVEPTNQRQESYLQQLTISDSKTILP